MLWFLPPVGTKSHNICYNLFKVIFDEVINMNGISKADWKLFMEKVPEWQEAYMERSLK